MANKIYVVSETASVFGSEVGDDVAWTTESVPDNAGRVSALHDRGVLTTAKAGRYMVRFFTQVQATTPVIGNVCELYNKTSDGTHPDNDDVGDVAVSSEDKLRNLHPMLPAVVDEAAANIEFVSFTPELNLSDRHISFALWNVTGASTTADVAETKAILTPLPPEIQ